ncbi:MAG: hypothetical protein ACOZF0_17460 [Thermodesulfobacteriota bacterium]
MVEKSVSDQCSNDTQEFIINIPCRLAERVERYAKDSGNTITGVIIEALDALLRGRKTD